MAEHDDHADLAAADFPVKPVPPSAESPAEALTTLESGPPKPESPRPDFAVSVSPGSFDQVMKWDE
jgi:hypothetical protein